MAKRKTKKEQVIDLKPKAEKITTEDLSNLHSYLTHKFGI